MGGCIIRFQGFLRIVQPTNQYQLYQTLNIFVNPVNFQFKVKISTSWRVNLHFLKYGVWWKLYIPLKDGYFCWVVKWPRHIFPWDFPQVMPCCWWEALGWSIAADPSTARATPTRLGGFFTVGPASRWSAMPPWELKDGVFEVFHHVSPGWNLISTWFLSGSWSIIRYYKMESVFKFWGFSKRCIPLQWFCFEASFIIMRWECVPRILGFPNFKTLHYQLLDNMATYLISQKLDVLPFFSPYLMLIYWP